MKSSQSQADPSPFKNAPIVSAICSLVLCIGLVN
jgi:hypothetical protein